jgi:hypothetical protein
MYEHVPLRIILDSGSKESSINRKILTDHSMDPAKICQLSEEEQLERNLLTLPGSPLTPTHEVTLYWHLVVDNDDVDAVIGSALWSVTEGPSRGYLVIPGF